MGVNMKKVLCILILLFNAFLCFSYDIGYVESFNLSKIQFIQEINISSEIITVHELETEVNLEIEPIQNISVNVECIIYCQPRGNGRSYTDTMVPIEFEVFTNNKNTNIWIIKNSKKYSYEESLKQNGHSNEIYEIHFIIEIKGKTQLMLKYVNGKIGTMGIDRVNYRFASSNSYKEVKYIENTDCDERLFLTSITPAKENTNHYDVYHGEFYGKIYDEFYNEYDGIKGFDIERKITENNTLIWSCVIPKETEIVDCWLEEIDYLYYMHESYILTKENVFFMPRKNLAIYRNGYYAKYGYEFKNNEWKNFFTDEFKKYGKEYKVNPNFSESDFNEIERKNIELIKKMENLKEPILLSEFLEENSK